VITATLAARRSPRQVRLRIALQRVGGIDEHSLENREILEKALAAGW
jgi:hypothetical protein